MSAIYAQEAKVGDVSIKLGYESFPGTFFSTETSIDTTASNVEIYQQAAEESATFSGLSVRMSKMANIFTEGMSGGIEVGFAMPLSGFEKTWEIAAVDPLALELIAVTPGIGTWPDTEYSTKIEVKVDAYLIPVLGKLAYAIKIGDNSLNLGMGAGAYIMRSSSEFIMTTTYVGSNDAPWKIGDVDEDIYNDTYIGASLGGEFSAEFVLPITEKMKLGIGGRIGVIGKLVNTYEDNDKDFETHSATLQTVYTLKEGSEIGGLTYGFGVSVNFPF